MSAGDNSQLTLSAKALSEMGASKGGLARAERLSAEERKDIARLGAESRWQTAGDLPRATHEGTLSIAGVEIQCAVLEDGRRVITQSGFMRALGRARQAKGRGYYDADENMPAFLTAKNLKPFIPIELSKSSSQIEFRPVGGRRAYGYSAELLPTVCGVFLDALDADAVPRGQLHIAQKAKMLMRGLATVGIVALVDEATGYEDVRDRKALQAILDLYLRKELAAWAKRFPDQFYEEMFRLRGWEWKPSNTRRTHAVAKYTNDLVYLRLAPELLRELEDLNPRDERGHRKAKHHQWLTEDVGHRELAKHLHGVIALMRASDTWDQFKELVDRALPRKTRVEDLPLFKPLPVDV